MCSAGRALRAAVYGTGQKEVEGSGSALLNVRRAVERKDGTSFDGEW